MVLKGRKGTKGDSRATSESELGEDRPPERRTPGNHPIEQIATVVTPAIDPRDARVCKCCGCAQTVIDPSAGGAAVELPLVLTRHTRKAEDGVTQSPREADKPAHDSG
jgi:hypothetical protein